MFDFETILELDGVPFEIHGIYILAEREIWKDGILDQPEIPDDIDLLDIKLGNEGLTQGQEDALIEGYGNKEFCEWLLEEGKRIFKEEKENARIDALM